MAKKIITVDSSFGILAGEEDVVLVHEIVRHFTERWRGEAAENKDYDLKASVDKMLGKISIEHEMIEFDNMNVLSGAVPATAPTSTVKSGTGSGKAGASATRAAGETPVAESPVAAPNPMLAH